MNVAGNHKRNILASGSYPSGKGMGTQLLNTWQGTCDGTPKPREAAASMTEKGRERKHLTDPVTSTSHHQSLSTGPAMVMGHLGTGHLPLIKPPSLPASCSSHDTAEILAAQTCPSQSPSAKLESQRDGSQEDFCLCKGNVCCRRKAQNLLLLFLSTVLCE